ncbi:2,3-diketo-L-gulonate TRAP transporter small permease protein YiaM [Sulfitobacter sp. THAF37]|uniref:TRAP transporter small permease n=1 Tax=Sulfitobacter sp. THAF37 TaxID=2587855 RepID=UPI001267B657|nr:TRAP transporter small permease [Sulfitobacter sp. THAF37]QFT60187.1 2,3-diketo-L-gulonate TRAP transporter small permease protein YiaM [Sulfitobacter sp. THAF37]
MSASRYEPKGAFGRFIHTFEETAIAVLLGLMTLVTFVNVVLRYVFNHALIWGLELTLVLFAWLVLFGISYCVKVTAHLGVDAVTSVLPTGPKRWLAILSGLICVFYAVLMMKGAWDFWAPFAGFNPTEGRWFPTGFVERRSQSFYESDQIPIPFQWMNDWLAYTFNSFMDGNQLVTEPYEKMPRLVPYVILPLGCALLLFRFVQATLGVIAGRRESMIVSHEAEEAVEKAAAEDAKV